MIALLTPLMATLGPWAVLLLMGVLFAETGLLVGFFLPGDSLLFAAGVLVASGAVPLPLWLVAAGAAVAAVVGDQVAYLIGRRWGPRLFTRSGSRWMSPTHLQGAQRFFDRHGPKAVVIARLLPGARAMTPVVAGTAGMSRRRFAAYNVLGGLLWTVGLLAAGFLLGGVALVAQHIELLAIGVVLVSVVPAAVVLARRHAVLPRLHRAFMRLFVRCRAWTMNSLSTPAA